MLVGQRAYAFRPSQAAVFLEPPLTVCDGHKRVVGNMIGYFTTEIGPVNQTVHLWGYDSLNERTRRRLARNALQCCRSS